jgi:hypothetical protein
MRASRTWLAALAIAAVTFCCRDAAGQPTVVEFKILSPGHALTLNSGTKVRYYKLTEFLKLAEFDKELVKLRADVQDLGNLNNKLKIQLRVLETKLIPTLEHDKELLYKRSDRLEERWHKAEKELVKASGGPIWPYVVGAVGIAVGAVCVGLYVECKLNCH